MKKLIIAFTFFSLTFLNSYSQDKDFKKEILTYDLSNIWMTENSRFPLGFIGEDFYRFHIHFISVIKNLQKPEEYFVYSKTMVKNNICEFQGVIIIKDAIKYSEKYIAKDTFQQGMLTAEYTFYESRNQKHSGKFEGKNSVNWYLDKNNKIYYDDLMVGADGFKNNRFIGSWKSNDSKTVKKCNWGDFRIPDDKDLDQGDGQFHPNEKYKKNGWENLIKANHGDDAANKLEYKEWWK